MIGYKLFDENLCCRGFQFEVGKTYTKDTKKEDLQCCTDKVFHYCREVHYLEEESPYRLHDSRICEVIAGDYVKEGQKYGTNKLTILREITGNEKLELIKDMCNIINQNNGYCNDGIRNTGNHNSGNHNTGDCNKGNLNSGYSNNGSCNAGSWNTGNRNTGNRNTGNWNTGDRNTGNWNTGSWNTGNYNNGFFNTDDAYVRMFNKETTLKKSEINLPSFLYFDLTEGATTDEYKKAFRIAWDKASKDEHKKLLDLPNWNNEIFKEISGIDAEEEIWK